MSALENDQTLDCIPFRIVDQSGVDAQLYVWIEGLVPDQTPAQYCCRYPVTPPPKDGGARLDQAASDGGRAHAQLRGDLAQAGAGVVVGCRHAQLSAAGSASRTVLRASPSCGRSP